MKRGELILGIDLGGTKIRAALLGADGVIVGTPESVPTCARSRNAEEIYSEILQLARRQIGTHEVKGVGIGSTGPLDFRKGMILDCDNLPSMRNFPLADRLSGDLGLPVRLDNDANAFILAEHRWGSAKGADNAVGVTLGTGLGLAIIANGTLVRGAHDCAGEVWTSPYKGGIIEEFASGSYLGGPDADDERFEAFADALADALSWIVNVCDPSVVVLGGSVTASAERFLVRMEEKLKKQICRSVSENLEIKLATLGADSGVMGAATLFM